MGDVIPFPRTRPAEPPSERPHAPERDPWVRPIEMRQPLWRETIGEVLRAERREADRTLQDVATEAGISVQYLSEIERGRKEPSSEVLGAVTGALGLRLVDLSWRISQRLSAGRSPLALAA